MSVSIDLSGPGDRLEMEEARDVLRLYPAVAGAHVTIRLKIARTQPVEGQLRIAAVLYVGQFSHARARVTELRHTGYVAPGVRQSDVVLDGFISNEQLRAAEAIRDGLDTLWMTLSLDIQSVGTVREQIFSRRGEISFPVSAGEWSTELSRADAGGHVELLVPMPATAPHEQMVRRLKDARDLLRAGDIDAALGAARMALEPVLYDVRDRGLSKSANSKPAKDRDLDERYAVMIEATYSTLSGATHDDAITKNFVYTRRDAEAILATVAALIHRHIGR